MGRQQIARRHLPAACHALICAIFLTALPASRGATPSSFAITLAEQSGVARSGECAVFGVPVPRDWQVTDARQFGLTDSGGTALPAQFEILARWAGCSTNASAYAKWVLVSYLASVAADGAGTVYLNHSGASPAPGTSITISAAEAGRITIDTGAAQFRLNTDAFNLFEQVTVSGQTMLDTLGATAAIAYQDMGGVSIVAGGSPDLVARATTAVIERSGPLYAVIKIEGSIMHGAVPVLDYTTRLHFYAGSAEARVDFTVENNHPVEPDGMGQPVNARSKGAVNSVYIGSLRLNLRLRDNGAALHALTEQSVAVDNPAATLSLYQGSSGSSNWNVYTGTPGYEGEEASSAPRVQAMCTNRGFIVSYAGSTVSGNHSEGWMTAYRDGGPRVTAIMRDFWQNYPKAIEAGPDGSLSINLYPDGAHFQHNFRVGEEKTDSILFNFGVGSATAAACTQKASAFNRPLFGVAEPAWYTNATVLGEVPPASTNEWPLYENYVRTAYQSNPAFDPEVDDPSYGNSTLQSRAIEGFDFYGWQDYGDVPLDYEPFDTYCAGQMNLKYWYTYGFFVQFCRSGDLRWLNLALPAARHLADLDIQHTPDGGATHWSHGAYYGHSQHNERGDLNPNRNYNSPSVDLTFGIPDLLLAYHMTGERRFREVALESLVGNKNMSQYSDFTAPIPDRERANLVFGYLEGYRETGETRWLTEITNIVGQTANLSNKSWLTNPDAYGDAHPGESVKMFCLAQTLWTMGKYLDLCVEYGFSDPFNVAAALQAYCNFIINYTMVNTGPNASATIFQYFFDHSDLSYVDHNNWALVLADVMTYAYKYSADTNYLQSAARLYNTGVIDPQWSNDPPVYMDTKGLVNSMNWGLVYMNQTRTGAPDPGPGPGPGPGPDPDPDTGPSILANNKAGSLTISQGVPVSITAAMVPGAYAGIEADWWVVALALNTGEWYYLDANMQWTPFSGNVAKCQPAYQGPLFALPATTLLNGYIFPQGSFNFYFGVDQRDGILNYPEGPILYDLVTIIVQ